jgi:hypothetical protein
MILDAFQMFDLPANPRNLAQVVGTYASNNTLDYGIASGIPSSANGGGARDMGIGDDPALKLFVQVSTAFVSAGGGTLQVTFQGSIDDTTGAPSTFSSWWSSPLYTIAQLVAGARLFSINFPRPPQGVAVPRFCRLLYSVATATITAGQVVSGVVLDRNDPMYQSTDNSIIGGYQAGINVAN